MVLELDGSHRLALTLHLVDDRLKMEAYGNRADRANPFHWARVVLNLLGKDGYQPHLPWMMKLRWDGHLATEVSYHVDNGRALISRPCPWDPSF